MYRRYFLNLNINPLALVIIRLRYVLKQCVSCVSLRQALTMIFVKVIVKLISTAL